MKKGAILWLNGLAGSGKSTIAKAVLELLRQNFDNVLYLDGDVLRELLGHFDYDKASRIQMALKRAKMAKFLSEQGQIVLLSTISLFNESYDFNRKHLKAYFEVFIHCDFEELTNRDQKGLYTRALKGLEKNVVGLDLAYDEPKPDLSIDNSKLIKLEEKAKFIFEHFIQFYFQLD